MGIRRSGRLRRNDDKHGAPALNHHLILPAFTHCHRVMLILLTHSFDSLTYSVEALKIISDHFTTRRPLATAPRDRDRVLRHLAWSSAWSGSAPHGSLCSVEAVSFRPRCSPLSQGPFKAVLSSIHLHRTRLNLNRRLYKWHQSSSRQPHNAT
jgi:hypothetical protein